MDVRLVKGLRAKAAQKLYVNAARESVAYLPLKDYGKK